MPCVSADGKPTGSGMKTLAAVKDGASTSTEVADTTGNPMFKVRSGLRELVNAGFLEEVDGKFILTSTGSDVF